MCQFYVTGMRNFLVGNLEALVQNAALQTFYQQWYDAFWRVLLCKMTFSTNAILQEKNKQYYDIVVKVDIHILNSAVPVIQNSILVLISLSFFIFSNIFSGRGQVWQSFKRC